MPQTHLLPRLIIIKRNSLCLTTQRLVSLSAGGRAAFSWAFDAHAQTFALNATIPHGEEATLELLSVDGEAIGERGCHAIRHGASTRLDDAATAGLLASNALGRLGCFDVLAVLMGLSSLLVALVQLTSLCWLPLSGP